MNMTNDFERAGASGDNELGSMPPVEEQTTSGRKIYATLIRGELHWYNNKFFRRNEPMLVTEAEKEHLEEHAVDNLSVDGEEIFKPKFKFEAHATVDVSSKQPEVRGRARKQ